MKMWLIACVLLCVCECWLSTVVWYIWNVLVYMVYMMETDDKHTHCSLNSCFPFGSGEPFAVAGARRTTLNQIKGGWFLLLMRWSFRCIVLGAFSILFYKLRWYYFLLPCYLLCQIFTINNGRTVVVAMVMLYANLCLCKQNKARKYYSQAMLCIQKIRCTLASDPKYYWIFFLRLSNIGPFEIKHLITEHIFAPAACPKE